MSKRFALSTAALIVFFLAGGCATRGPVVPVAPSAQVAQLDSLLFTPDVIKFQAVLLIDNLMDEKLHIQKIDWGADVNGRPVFTESFTRLKTVSGNGRETVTFPFQIAMKDIETRSAGVSTGETITVSFRGLVQPADSGFGPVPFRMAKSIPLPKAPAFSLEGTEGSPLKVFTVFLKVKNANAFPLTITSMKSYLELNGTRYDLLKTERSTELKPGASETIALKMEQTLGKKLGIALALALSSSLEFNLGGDINCETPYGGLSLPLKLHSAR